jgi:hypothetical protein
VKNLTISVILLKFQIVILIVEFVQYRKKKLLNLAGK